MIDGLKVGLWGARADRTGLAIQSTELARHLPFDKIMGFGASRGPGQPKKDRPSDWSVYNGSYELTTDDDFWSVTEARAKTWLEGLDVVWAVETFYQDDFPRWALETGVATIQHCNPEFYRYILEPRMPKPTMVLVPTTWRLDAVPGAEVLSTPVATDRVRWMPRPLREDILTFLHVVGIPAAEDRNGTNVLLEALKFLRRECRVVIKTQDRSIPLSAERASCCQLVVYQEPVNDYWTLYDHADVLVLPRRYGGQCLSAQEAYASGLPVLMTDLEPQRGWLEPDCLVDLLDERQLLTQAGTIPVHDPSPVDLAQIMDYLSQNHDRVRAISNVGRDWAARHSWDALRPTYEDIISRARKRFLEETLRRR